MHETADVLTRLASLETELARLKTLVTNRPSATSDAAVAVRDVAGSESSASRRDLLRYGAAAIGAAAAAGIATHPVESANGDAIIIGALNNSGTGDTYLTTTSTYGLFVTSNGGSSAHGLIGQSGVIGTRGATNGLGGDGAGVLGNSTATTSAAPGVYGFAISPNAPGVYGLNANGGHAMRAEIPAGVDVHAVAHYAWNRSTYTGGGPGAGGFAIYGLSVNGHGLVGATGAAGAAAVVGATNGVAGAYAAAFYGPVVVGGNFTVIGGAKSAAVPHPDGSHRRLYCVESPESWFEDFGRGTLACGEAAVALDADFAALVDTAAYHVFLTGYDGRSDLSVCDCSPEGFRVRGSEGAEGTFSWRVIAKRRDIAGPRLERVEIPRKPTLPEAPASIPEPASLPDLSRMPARLNNCQR